MNKFTYILFSLLFFLPMNLSAQEEVTIIVNDENQNVTGTLVTISDTEEYIDTETHLYQITDKNTMLVGDVNIDKIIDVNDVTGMIDFIMDNIYSKIADMNEDKEVSVDDITYLVDTIFGAEEEKTIVESYEVVDITDVWVSNKTAPAVDQH